MLYRIFGLIVVLGSLSACTTGRNVALSEDFGNSVNQNIAVQTINPDAGGDDDSDSMDGQKAAQAVERYREMPAEVDDQSLVQGVGG